MRHEKGQQGLNVFEDRPKLMDRTASCQRSMSPRSLAAAGDPDGSIWSVIPELKIPGECESDADVFLLLIACLRHCAIAKPFAGDSNQAKGFPTSRPRGRFATKAR